MDISNAKCGGCGRTMQIKRLGCSQCELTIEGALEIPPLARLSAEDQVFVHAFVRHHGSIKKMEKLFGISYPTVKNRLRAITAELDESFTVPSANSSVLEALARGELTVEEALDRIS